MNTIISITICASLALILLGILDILIAIYCSENNTPIINSRKIRLLLGTIIFITVGIDIILNVFNIIVIQYPNIKNLII